jgi:predicted MFS family arabinose efflux permease
MIVISMFVAAFAPLVAGVVIQAFGWPYVYLVTMMGGLVTLFLRRRVRYPQIMPATARFDYLGSLLVFLSVTLLITGIMQAGVGGLTSSVVLLLVGMGLMLGIVLVVVSLRKSQPLIQFRLLKIRNVAIAVFVTLMRFLPRVLMSAFLARYAQQVLGLSPATTGLLMIVPVLAQVGAAPIAGRMLDQDGPRAPVSLGVVLLLGGLICLAFGFPTQNIWLVLFGSILGEAGFAFTNPVQMAALNQTPLAQRGMLAGIFPLAGQFGTALWVALLTAGMSTFMVTMVAGDSSMSDATAQANALGMLSWIGAVVTLATLVASLFLRNTRTQPSAFVADAKN